MTSLAMEIIFILATYTPTLSSSITTSYYQVTFTVKILPTLLCLHLSNTYCINHINHITYSTFTLNLLHQPHHLLYQIWHPKDLEKPLLQRLMKKQVKSFFMKTTSLCRLACRNLEYMEGAWSTSLAGLRCSF